LFDSCYFFGGRAEARHFKFCAQINGGEYSNNDDTRLTASVSRTTLVSWHQKGLWWSKRWWGGIVISLHLAVDRCPRQHLINQFLQAGCSSVNARPTVSKHWRQWKVPASNKRITCTRMWVARPLFISTILFVFLAWR